MKQSIPFWSRVLFFFQRRFRTAQSEQEYIPNPTRIEQGTWHQINTAKLAKRFHIEARAEEDGHNEVPPSHAYHFITGGAQAEILQWVNNRVSKDHAACEERLLVRNNAIEKCKAQIEESIEELERAGRRFRLRLLEIEESLLPDLRELDGDLAESERELQEFQKENKITRPPRDPESKLWKFGVVALAFLGEGILNAYFFALGSPLGILGGVLQALLFAGIDAIVVVSLGVVVARFESRRILHKLEAFTCFCAFIAWMVSYNLFVSHYREAAQQNPENAQQAAFDAMLTNHFTLEQPDSYLLLVIGAIISIVGVWTGYYWRDPIPGYEKIGSLHKQAKNSFRRLHRIYLQEIRGAREKALDGISAAASRSRSHLDMMGDLIRRKEHLIRNFQKYRKLAEEICNALIRIYQDANEKARKTPAPAYFNTKTEISSPKELAETRAGGWNEHRNYKDQLGSLTGENRTLKQDIRHLADEAEKSYVRVRKAEFKSKGAKQT